MLIRHIITLALQKTWQEKRLWLIGILTLTPLTLQNEWQLLEGVMSALARPEEYFQFFPILSPETYQGLTLSNLISVSFNAPLHFLAFLIIIILIITVALLFSWIIMNGQALLIFRLNPAKKKFNYSLSQSLNKVSPFWISLLQINLALVLAKILVISLLFFAFKLFGGPTIFGIIWWLITAASIVLLMSFSFILRFSLFKIILEKISPLKAIKQSYQLFKKYYLECFEFSLVIYILVTLALFFIISIIRQVIAPNQFGEVILAILLLKQVWWLFFGTLAATTAFLIITSALFVWQYSAWLIWYEQMLKQALLGSRIKKLLKKIRLTRNKTLNND